MAFNIPYEKRRRFICVKDNRGVSHNKFWEIYTGARQVYDNPWNQTGMRTVECTYVEYGPIGAKNPQTKTFDIRYTSLQQDVERRIKEKIKKGYVEEELNKKIDPTELNDKLALLQKLIK